mgnify:CR=1 FL=1
MLDHLWTPRAVHPDLPTVREHYRHQERQLLDRALFYIARNLLTEDERVRIVHPAGDVWVMMIRREDGRNYLGVEAPREVNIVREEVLRRELGS